MASRKYTDTELLEIMNEMAIKLYRTPRMKDMMKVGPPYPSIYQRRFSSDGHKQDGWNRALEKAGLIVNRTQIDQETLCSKCGVDGNSENGRIIRWIKTNEPICMKCYQKAHHKFKKEN